MVTSTDPAVLDDQARCFNKCVMPGDQMGIQTYLLAQIAIALGVTGININNPGALADAARCFNHCIPPGDMLGVQNYLLVLLNNK